MTGDFSPIDPFTIDPNFLGDPSTEQFLRIEHSQGIFLLSSNYSLIPTSNKGTIQLPPPLGGSSQLASD